MPASTADRLPPTADPRCGTYNGYSAHYNRGENACQPCKDARRDSARRRRATPAGRAASREAMRKANDNRRARTAAEADASFVARWPQGRACKACGVVLPADGFARNWTEPDGRERRCSVNGCHSLHNQLKRWTKLVPHWLARGLDPGACAYCLSPIGPGTRDVDHFNPSARGGANSPDNLIPACPSCNRGAAGKFDRLPFEWLAATHPDRVDFFRALFPEEN